MKTFKDRLIALELETTVQEVKNECKRILEIVQFGNEHLLRESILEALSMLEVLSNVKLDKPAKKFFENELKIQTINTMKLEKSFNDIFESEVFNKNVQIQYPLNGLYKSYKNGFNTIYIAESLLEIIKPYDYDPKIERVVNQITEIFKKYPEDIDLVKSIYEMKASKYSLKFNNIIDLLEEHFYEKKSRRSLIEKMKIYSYDPNVMEAIKRIAKYENDDSMFLVNENQAYDVNNVYSFIYIDSEVSEDMKFYTNGRYFNFNGTELTQLSENEKLVLPETFKTINEFINNGYVKVTENKVLININNSQILLEIRDNLSNRAFLNNIEITNDVYKNLMESKLFSPLHYSDLSKIKKVWENLDTLINIDIAQEIKSKQGFSKATIFKVNEEFYLLKSDPQRRISIFEKNINGLQLRNSLFEFMKYDISEKLFEYLKGPAKEIGRLKEKQSQIQTKINELHQKLIQIDEQVKADILLNDSKSIETINKLKIIIEDEINKLKSEYFSLEESINKISNINEDDNALKAGDTVRIKNSGIVGKITAINTITKEISILDDEGNTISVSLDDIEKIDGEIAQNLTDIEAKAAKANSLHFATEKDERAKKLFGKLKNLN
jgi:preprotein translocase subunit YajC